MDFSALMANPKVKDMLITAGLSMLANNQPRVGQPKQTFGASLGQGLLGGMQYANQQEDQQRQEYWQNYDRGVNAADTATKMGMAGRQLDATIANMEDQRKQGWARLDDSASDRLYKQEADARDFKLKQDQFSENVRQYDDEAQYKRNVQNTHQETAAAQNAKTKLDIEKEQRTLQAQQRAKQILPAFANAIRMGQAPEISGEDFAAIAEAYPKLLEQYSQAQTTLMNPETGQKMVVPIGQAIQGWKAKASANTDEDAMLKAFAQDGNADPVAKMVQGALSQVPPEQLEAAKAQIRQELTEKGYTPSDYGL